MLNPLEPCRPVCASRPRLPCRLRVGLIAAFLLLACRTPWAPACTVPVFRYGLERWPADDYEILVFHRGEMAPKDAAVLNWLREQVSGDEATWNAALSLIDVDSLKGAIPQRIWRAQRNARLPWVVVRYPYPSRIESDAWSGPLIADSVRQLAMSPVRQELARRLLRGHSAVWVVVRSGDAAKDRAATTCLGREIKAIQDQLKLPEDDPNLDANVPVAPGDPIPVVFSMIEVSRGDPNEALLLQMLLNVESDLQTLSEPIAFPIFGRGRLLPPLVGEGINPDMIREVCAFVAAPCSCVIKDVNPGVDLLMSVPWDMLIEEPVVSDAEFARLTGRPLPPSKRATTGPGVASSAATSTAARSSPVLRNSLVTLGGMFVLILLLSLTLRRRTANR
jgi:hypothetical protein